MKRSNIWDWAFTPHFIYLVLEKRPNYHVCKSDGGIAASSSYSWAFVVILWKSRWEFWGLAWYCEIVAQFGSKTTGNSLENEWSFVFTIFNNIKVSYFESHMKRSFSLCLVDAVLLLDTVFWCFRLCLVMKVMKIMVGSEARQRPLLVWVLAVKATVIWPWDRWDSKDIYVGLHPKAKDDKEANPENPDSTPDGRTKRQNSMMRSKFLVSSPTSFQFIRV